MKILQTALFIWITNWEDCSSLAEACTLLLVIVYSAHNAVRHWMFFLVFLSFLIFCSMPTFISCSHQFASVLKNNIMEWVFTSAQIFRVVFVTPQSWDKFPKRLLTCALLQCLLICLKHRNGTLCCSQIDCSYKEHSLLRLITTMDVNSVQNDMFESGARLSSSLPPPLFSSPFFFIFMSIV